MNTPAEVLLLRQTWHFFEFLSRHWLKPPAVDQVTCVAGPSHSEGEMQLFLQITLIVSSLLLVLLVLLHRGRGGGLSSLFGGGMQSSLSGSSVVEKNLDRITLFVGAV